MTANVLEKICYKKSFLKQVVLRIDFLPQIQELAKAVPSKLARVITRHFPISEPIEGIAKNFQLSLAGVEQKDEAFKHWNYFGKDREKRLLVAPNFLVFEYTRYPGYDEMFAQFTEIVQSVISHFPEARASRFGLRYVNSIEGLDPSSPGDWDQYLAPELLASRHFLTDAEPLTRLMQAIELRFGEISLRYQFGMPNPDYPAVMKRLQFVLDFDAYVEIAHDLSHSLGYVVQAHELIQKFFERSITEKLRSKMNAKS
jgi:uncharacterized protein (TIGR04255 family)